MIPEEVENRIAKYFLHNYLPEEVMMEIENRLLSICLCMEEEELDLDGLVNLAIGILRDRLGD